MKKLLLTCAAALFLFAANAQTAKPKAAAPGPKKETVKGPDEHASPRATNHHPDEHASPRATEKGNGPVLKKDGTPDKRYKQNQHLRKDGKPDQRYKENKETKKPEQKELHKTPKNSD